MKITMYGVTEKAINQVSKYLSKGWLKEITLVDEDNRLYDIVIDAIVKINSERVWIDYCGAKEYIKADDFVKLEVF